MFVAFYFKMLIPYIDFHSQITVPLGYICRIYSLITFNGTDLIQLKRLMLNGPQSWNVSQMSR